MKEANVSCVCQTENLSTLNLMRYTLPKLRKQNLKLCQGPELFMLSKARQLEGCIRALCLLLPKLLWRIRSVQPEQICVCVESQNHEKKRTELIHMAWHKGWQPLETILKISSHSSPSDNKRHFAFLVRKSCLSVTVKVKALEISFWWWAFSVKLLTFI